MFGYVKVNKPELKVREYEFYKGTYCGLCRAMGKCTGQCSRLTLSYDIVFLALMRIGSSGERVSFSSSTCIAHPLKKRAYMESNPTLEYCASAAAILNYHKIKDDLSDEKGAKKLRAALALPFAAHGRRKALKRGVSALDDRVKDGLSRLAHIEGSEKCSVDEPARVFGDILGEILSFGIDGDKARILRTLGASVGKWIYIADALDDWEEDAKKGGYNPFILLYGKEKPTDTELDGIKVAMKNELLSAESALDLIDIENADVKHVIENILFLGLPSRVEEITAENKRNPERKRINDRPIQGTRRRARRIR